MSPSRLDIRALFLSKDFSVLLIVAVILASSALSAAATYYEGAQYITGPGVGYLEDYSHFAMIVSAILAIFSLKFLQSSIHRFFYTKKRYFIDRNTERRLRIIENFVLLEDKKGRLWFRNVLVFCIALFLIFQFALPFSGVSVASWALMPGKYSYSFITAAIGSFIVFVFILSHFIWYGFCTLFFIFGFLNRHALYGEVALHLFDQNANGNIARISSMAFGLIFLTSPLSLFGIAYLLIFDYTLIDFSIFVVYSFVLLVMFIFPFYVIYRYIESGKSFLLDRLSRISTRNLYAVLDENVHSDKMQNSERRRDDDKLHNDVAMIANLDRIASQISSVSLWSTSFAFLTQSASLVLIPILAAGAQGMAEGTLLEFLKVVIK